MKNIFFYLSPEKKFNKEYVLMSEAQIDNSLDYWDLKDIIVVTNFPWEYRGIKSTVVGDEVYCSILSHGLPLSNKPNVIIYLIENNLVDDINWIHDWDAFQIAPLDLPPLKKDIGFMDYGYKPRIQFGNIFFKPAALDVFKWISKGIYRYNTDEEETTNILIKENFNNINDRFEKLNTTYNVSRKVLKGLDKIKVDMPFKIAHFKPHSPKYLHKFSKTIPPKLFKMLSDKFTPPKEIIDLQSLEFSKKRRIWQPFMEKYNCQKIAEIGILEAQNFKRMIAHEPEIAVAVDHWREDGVAARNDGGFTQETLDRFYENFKSDMVDKSFVKTYREYTVDAAKHFPDNYFDLIYIDADHSYEGCKADIEAWYPKVKKGGFIIGDDYSDYVAPVTGVVFGVVKAVTEFSKKYNLKIYELPSHGWVAIK